jgi:hypothetical protein
MKYSNWCTIKKVCTSFNFKSKLLWFEYVKDLYNNDVGFSQIYKACENLHLINFIGLMVICLKKKRLWVPNCYMSKLLVREAYEVGLMRHFRVSKILYH